MDFARLEELGFAIEELLPDPDRQPLRDKDIRVKALPSHALRIQAGAADIELGKAAFDDLEIGANGCAIERDQDVTRVSPSDLP